MCGYLLSTLSDEKLTFNRDNTEYETDLLDLDSSEKYSAEDGSSVRKLTMKVWLTSGILAVG